MIWTLSLKIDSCVNQDEHNSPKSHRIHQFSQIYQTICPTWLRIGLLTVMKSYQSDCNRRSFERSHPSVLDIHEINLTLLHDVHQMSSTIHLPLTILNR